MFLRVICYGGPNDFIGRTEGDTWWFNGVESSGY